MKPLLTILVFISLFPGPQPELRATEAVPPPSAAAVKPLMPAFDELVAESGMRFELPEGFREVERHANPLFTCDKAVRNRDGSVEIRYAVRPLGRIEIDYQDPHSSAPDPNHMFPLMFQSMVTLLSDGRHSPTREYPKDQAREKFSADWAAAAVFDVSPGFGTEYKQALVIALHKNQLADAYSVFLFDDFEQVRQKINDNLNALAFLP